MRGTQARKFFIVAAWLCAALLAVAAPAQTKKSTGKKGKNKAKATAPEQAAPPVAEAKPLTPEAAAAEAKEGYVAIFDGKSLAGWEGDAKIWSAEGSELIGKCSGLPTSDYLVAARQYGDFDIKCQIKICNPETNSGIQFRSVRIPNTRVLEGYQADHAVKHWGLLWHMIGDKGNAKLAGPPDEEGKKLVSALGWCDLEVRAEGDKIQMWLNGTKVVDYVEKDPKMHRAGIIGLQVKYGSPQEVRFRSIRIKELGGKQ